MRNISLDFSTKTDLRWLSDLMAVFHEAAGDTPLLLVGATVRDLLLEQAHAIRLLRATDDVDIACIAETWDAFLSLRGASPDLRALHRSPRHSASRAVS